MKKLSIIATVLASAFLSLTCDAAETVVLDNVRIFYGTSESTVANGRVVIQADKIVDVGPRDSVKFDGAAKVIDYSGKTVIPGLISNHVHLGQYDATTASSPYNKDTIQRQLLQYTAYGVTTVTSLGVNGGLFYELRTALHRGELPGADIFGADRGIGVPMGAPPVKVGADQLDRPSTPEEARAAVRGAVSRHADLIKIWLDDFQGAKLVKMEPAVYRAVIDEAHKNGLKVVAHIYYLQDAKDLIKAGADVLGHGIRDKHIDQEFIDLARKHQTWYIPTLTVDEAFFRFAKNPELLQQEEIRRGLNPKLLAMFEDAKWREKQLANPALAQWQTGLKNNLHNTKGLVDAGLNVGFGTDSGAMPLRIPGYAEYHELELLVEAGLTPKQALTLATSKAAALLNLSDRGVLGKGKNADLVVVDGDPTSDIAALRRISAVWRLGKEVPKPSAPF
jgi:imidazolonepropionase-like amidohydrolase